MPFPDLLSLFSEFTDDLQWWQITLIVLDYALKIFALGWVPKERRPTSAMAWLLAIFLIPFIGIFLFLLMGSPAINRRRHRIQNQANELIRTMSADEPDVPEGSELSDELRSLVRLNRELTALPAVNGTMQALHSDYKESIAAITRAINSAKDYVNVEIYIMAWDDTTEPFFEALGRAAQRGVTVRVLWDHIGAHKYKGNKKLGKRLQAMGVDLSLIHI